MKVAILGEDFEDFTSLVREKAVVREDDCRPSSGLQYGQDVLNEVQLLIGRCDGEILTVGVLIGSFGAKGRISEHYVETVARRGLVDSIPEVNRRLDTVQVQVH